MLSIVIPALNEGEHLRRTVVSLVATAPAGTEIVVVDDGSDDGCADFLRGKAPPARLLEPEPGRLGVAGARNKGARAARGDAVLFSDAHMEFPPGWAEALMAALDNPSVGATAPAISVLGRPDARGYGLRWRDPRLSVEWLPCRSAQPHEAPLLPGACVALRREVFDETGGFDTGLARWGLEDAEFSLRVWTRGYDLCLVPAVTVAHLFRDRHPYAIDWHDVIYNTLRVAWIHFQPARLARVIDALRGHDAFAAALTRLATSDAGEQRAQVTALRARSDDAYFHRFGDL